MTESETEQLDRDGYLVLEDFVGPERLEALRRRIEEVFLEKGERAGSEFRQEPHTRRLANLVNCGEAFEKAIGEPRVLECVGHVLGPRFKLSSLNVRDPHPDSGWVQPLHCDVGAIPDERGFWVCNAIWLLDDFTAENGATRFVPGSHLWGRLPQDVLPDPVAPHPNEKLLTGRAGSVIIMNTHLWHGATANRTSGPRRAMHAFYCRWDKPQQQYQKQLLSAEVQRRLGPELRRLLALDDPLNDELSATQSGRSGFLK